MSSTDLDLSELGAPWRAKRELRMAVAARWRCIWITRSSVAGGCDHNREEPNSCTMVSHEGKQTVAFPGVSRTMALGEGSPWRDLEDADPVAPVSCGLWNPVAPIWNWSPPRGPGGGSAVLCSHRPSKSGTDREIDAFLDLRLKIELPDVPGLDPDATSYDVFGFPESEVAGLGPTWKTWIASCMGRARPTPVRCRDWLEGGGFNELYRKLEHDRLLSAALPVIYPRRQPSVLVESRGRGITGIFEEASNLTDPRCTHTHMVAATGVGLRVYDAPLYWIPGVSAAACLTSEPPDPELLARIRLPFPSVLVGFAEPVAITDLEDDGEYLVVGGQRRERTVENGGRFIEAVWLTSGLDGSGLGPVVVWFLQYGTGVDGASTAASVGLWSRSAFPAVVPNLAALLCWEKWEEPLSVPDGVGDEGSKEWRKALKRSAVKRAAQRGALHAVRVLSVPSPSRHPGVGPSPSSSRRAPIEHWRRGHWTSVRVATRDDQGRMVGRTDGEKDVDWHYEGRWVRPVLVNRGGRSDQGAKVYRLG